MTNQVFLKQKLRNKLDAFDRDNGAMGTRENRGRRRSGARRRSGRGLGRGCESAGLGCARWCARAPVPSVAAEPDSEAFAKSRAAGIALGELKYAAGAAGAGAGVYAPVSVSGCCFQLAARLRTAAATVSWRTLTGQTGQGTGAEHCSASRACGQARVTYGTASA